MFGEAIGEILPQAIGIALSPVPIIAVILMLLSIRASSTAPAFAIGWTVGILVVALVVALFVPASAASGQSGGGAVVGIVKLVLGGLFLVMAFGQWRKRPGPGETASLPKWMSSIDRMSPAAAFGVGLGLSAVNPKNLSLALAAGLSLAGLSGGQMISGLVVFVLLAACSVLIPVCVHTLFSRRMTAPLSHLKDWLTRNNATVMFTVLLVLGVTLIGKGIAAF